VLSESLGIRLPNVGFSLQNAGDFLLEQEHRNKLLNEYRKKHPLFGDTEESAIFKMYKLIKTKYPDSKVIPGDIGIQFKLADTITIRSNFLAFFRQKARGGFMLLELRKNPFPSKFVFSFFDSIRTDP